MTEAPAPDSPMEPVPAAPEIPQPARSRAGRNLPAAFAVGLALGLLVVLSLVVVRSAFLGVVGVALCLAVWELRNAMAVGGIRIPTVPLVVAALLMPTVAYLGGPDALLVAFALSALAGLGWGLADSGPELLRDVSAGLFALLYAPTLAGFTGLMLAPDDGVARIVTFVVVTVCSDVGGYAAGVLFGSHRMAPTVSPKKSWEGFAGSVVACVAGGVLCSWRLLDAGPWPGVLIGLAIVVSATVGDLGESLIKRDLGIKDMGSLLPGHGGLLDRLDSLLPTAPVAWLIMLLLVPVS